MGLPDYCGILGGLGLRVWLLVSLGRNPGNVLVRMLVERETNAPELQLWHLVPVGQVYFQRESMLLLLEKVDVQTLTSVGVLVVIDQD